MGRVTLEFSDLIALLLPVAAASGWFAARRIGHAAAPENSTPLTLAYRRGLNYLLEDKTDKALEAVSQILAHDSESLEIQLTLGNLFRRRGEVERAIEIHSRLRMESNLSEEQRARADLELGLDYMRAGLFDRAETLFLNLKGSSAYEREAHQHLLILYQQQKDWHRALECVLAMRSHQKPRHGETAAHFLCELAEEAMHLHRLKDARDLLAKALDDDPRSVRATIAKGRLEYANEEYRQALDTLRGLENQNPAFLAVVLPMIGQCAQRLGLEEQLVDYLDALYLEHQVMAAAIDRADRLAMKGGGDEAVDYLLPILTQTPDPLALNHAMGFLANDPLKGHSRLRQLQSLMDGAMACRQKFCCDRCGFGSADLYWRCPSCRHWGAMRPTGPFSSLIFLEAQDKSG